MRLRFTLPSHMAPTKEIHADDVIGCYELAAVTN